MKNLRIMSAGVAIAGALSLGALGSSVAVASATPLSPVTAGTQFAQDHGYGHGGGGRGGGHGGGYFYGGHGPRYGYGPGYYGGPGYGYGYGAPCFVHVAGVCI